MIPEFTETDCCRPPFCESCGKAAVCPPWALCWNCLPKGPPATAEGSAVEIRDVETVSTSPPKNPSNLQVVPVQLSSDDSSPVATSARCRHCQRAKVNRPRGLCWTCYYSPGVREHYTTDSPRAHRGVGNGNAVRPLPEPTLHPPGTVGKLLVLEARAAAGMALWHPDDRREGIALTAREVRRDARRHRERPVAA